MIVEDISDSRPGIAKPERTCAGCGKKSVKEDFLRFVFSPSGRVICDVRKNLQSRGVYLCLNKTCIKKGIKKKVFSRFLRVESAEPSFEALAEDIYKGFHSYIYTLMNLSLKSKKMLTGDSAVSDGVQKNKLVLLLIAKDAGRSVKEKFSNICKHKNIPIVEIDEKEDITSKLGVGITSIFGVVSAGFAAPLQSGWRLLSEVKSWFKSGRKDVIV